MLPTAVQKWNFDSPSVASPDEQWLHSTPVDD